jgi:hypothetical protein
MFPLVDYKTFTDAHYSAGSRRISADSTGGSSAHPALPPHLPNVVVDPDDHDGPTQRSTS